MRTSRAYLPAGIGLLGAMISLGPAIASDANGGFALHGVGAQTCKAMLQELQPVAAPVVAPVTAAMPVAGAPASATAAATAARSGAASPDAQAAASASAEAAAPRTDTAGRPAGSASTAPAATAPAAPSPATPVASPAAASAALGLRQVLTSWMMGYITASDRLVKGTFDESPIMAPEALSGMVIGVCRQNPEARVEAAAFAVLNQLATARLLHDSPVVEARAGDRAVLIRQATLIAMQRSLVQDKLLKEPADGRFGSGTAAALLAFQKSQHLPETGLPDASTVVRLLVEMPAPVAPAAPVAPKRPRGAR